MDGTLYPYNDQCRTVYKDMAVNLVKKHYKMKAEEAESTFIKLRSEEEKKCGQKVANTLVLLNNFDKIEFEDIEEEINSIYNVEEVLDFNKRAFETVKEICSKYNTLLYTMNNRKTTNRTLETIGMAKLFPSTRRYSFTTMGKLNLSRSKRIDHVKPGLAGYELVVKESSLNPEKCLMVGDSMRSDIEPAKALGMDGYLIKTFDDLYNLPKWLEM